MANRIKHIIVYQATNTVTGDFYIGCTTQGLAWRREQHINAAYSGWYKKHRFYLAIQAHGDGAFIWEVLSEFKTADEALAEEARLIREKLPPYNAAGIKGRPHKGGTSRPIDVLCLEQNRYFPSMKAASEFYGFSGGAVRDAVMGRVSKWGNLHFMRYSGPLTESERAAKIKEIDLTLADDRKYSNIQQRAVTNGRDILGRSAAGPMSNARPVRCLDDGMEFPSASAAATYYDIRKSSIIELCLGKNGRKQVGGRKFKYLDLVN